MAHPIWQFHLSALACGLLANLNCGPTKTSKLRLVPVGEFSGRMRQGFVVFCATRHSAGYLLLQMLRLGQTLARQSHKGPRYLARTGPTADFARILYPVESILGGKLDTRKETHVVAFWLKGDQTFKKTLFSSWPTGWAIVGRWASRQSSSFQV